MSYQKLFGTGAAVVAAGMMAVLGAAPAEANGAHLVRAGHGSAALEAMRHELAAGGLRSDAVRCWSGVTIESAANHRYVSTELAYGGGSHAMLRARAVEIGPWERYSVCRDSGTWQTIIRSDQNNLMVSAEIGYGGDHNGMLRARASVEGPWERYSTDSEPYSGSQVRLFALGNRTYVSAELGYGGDDNGMLRARALVVGPWEIFNW